MKLKQLFETKENDFTEATKADFDKWVETLVDMVENDKMSFDEALDEMLDNDPKFEAMSPRAQKRCLFKIKQQYYDTIH